MLNNLIPSRLERTHAFMAEQDVDVLLLTSAPNNQYFSGSPMGPSDRLAMTIVSPNGVVVLCPTFERERIESAGACGRFITWEETDNPYAIAADAMNEMKVGRTAVDDQMYYRVYEGLKNKLPGVEFVNGARIISHTRAVKEPGEMDAIRRAGEITLAAMSKAMDSCRPGMSEADVASIIIKSIKDAGAVPAFAIAQFGPNAAVPHHYPDATALKTGDLILFDCGCSINGFNADISRTVIFDGEPTEKMIEVYTTVDSACRAAHDKIKPGVQLQEFDRAARKVITDAGYGKYFTHRLGHGLGLEVHEEPYIIEGNETPADKGMVFTVEPGIYLPGEFGVRIEDDVAVTADGCELLTPAPTKPFSII